MRVDTSKWEKAKLGEVFTLQMGRTPDRKNEKYWKNGTMPWLSIADIKNNKYVSGTKEKLPQIAIDECKVPILPTDTVLMTFKLTIGKTCITAVPMATNEAIMAFLPKSNTIDNNYLFYALPRCNWKGNRAVKGITINKQIISAQEISYPSLSEQRAIAEELDGIQSMIGKCREQLEDYDRLARSIFHEMFGDPVRNEKGWDKQKLGDLFETSSGGTPSKKVSEYWENGNVPWIGSNMCQNCVISENDGKYITELGLAKSSAKLLQPGSILIAMVGATIGKVALLDFECATNQNVASINVNSNSLFTPLFVFYAIMGIYSIFQNIGEGRFTIASLSFIRDLSIITPPLPLQQQFAERIEAIEKMKEATKAQLADLQQLFDSRMQYYFS